MKKYRILEIAIVQPFAREFKDKIIYVVEYKEDGFFSKWKRTGTAFDTEQDAALAIRRTKEQTTAKEMLQQQHKVLRTIEVKD